VLRLSAPIVALAIVAVSCDERSGDREGDIDVVTANSELRLAATFHRKVAEAGTWHLLVHERGDMADLACFTTNVTPLLFYEKLRAIGIEAEDVVDCGAMGDLDAATEGDVLEYSFEWEGSGRRVALDELFDEVVPADTAAQLGLEMRFGGNHEGEDAEHPPSHRSGCLACLYTCCAGVTSNRRANLALLRRENGEHRYRVLPEVGPPDGAVVTVFVGKRR